MKKAYLNTLTGILTFTFEDMTFNLDVNIDPKDQWMAIKTKSGVYDYKFEWEEDSDPSFAIFPLFKEVNERTGSPFWTIDLKKGIPFKVELSEGSKEDWFKIDFPNGFLSFTDTLSVIMRDAPTVQPEFDRYVSNNGGMSFLEVARKWAFEFENRFKGVKWGIDEEYGDWEEELWLFTLTNMLEL